MDVDPGKVIISIEAQEELKLHGQNPIVRFDKKSQLKMKMRTTTKFEVMMEAFCKNVGLKKETLTFWFTDELLPSDTPEKVGMKSSDVVQVYPCESKENPKNKKEPTVPPSTFTSDFKRLWNNPELSDVAFKVNGTIIPAHKQILSARCRRFSAMFLNGMKESRQSEIEVECNDPKLFLALLEYLYADTVKLSNPDMSVQLMVLADEYLLPRLKEICENEIIKYVNVSNVAELMETAHKIDASLLKQFCLEFVLDNYAEVSSSAQFKTGLCTPDLMHEVIQAMGKKLPDNAAASQSKKRKKSST